MTSLAIDYHGEGVFAPRSYEPTDPGPGEVRIAVAFTGICGTDLTIAHGGMDRRIRSPWPIGHEMSGTVDALGPDVDDWAVGDNVTVMPLDWCDDCPACARGHQHICHNLDFVGIDSPGSLQQHWNLPARLLVRVPEGMPLQAASLAEPTAVAAHDIRRGEVTRSDHVVVIGGGPIGLLISLVAAHDGAKVLLSEVSEFRRDLATRLGLSTLDPVAGDLTETIHDWTDGVGADISYEVSGSGAGVEAMTNVLKVRGRGVVVAIHTTPTPVDLMAVFWKELEIRGTRVYERRDFERAVGLLADGVIPVDSLITDVVPLSDAPDAIERLASEKEIVKLLVDCR
ncbi:MAG: alcohol dehydrogenase catalytic domain-containing protein [Acidimicrobiia bacterium]|jgi:2-desacetyl-2-hydroxyethyl bacteriochlorophyllide A dehydrogenase